MYLTVEDTFPFLDKIPSGSLIEFGVFSGNTMNRLIKGAEEKKNPFRQVYGFDSFTGIPKETEGVLHNPEWPEGAFNLCKDFNLASVEEAIAFVRSRVARKDIQLIAGFFEETLTNELGGLLVNKFSYVHIDVDIYRSTIEVLNFILHYRILQVGGLVRYDDTMWCPFGVAGNTLAHLEMTRKYKVQWHAVSDNVFQLVSY